VGRGQRHLRRRRAEARLRPRRGARAHYPGRIHVVLVRTAVGF
jgi:hypothetical protein